MSTFRILAIAIAAALALAGCGKSEGKKAATQAAAKVNKEEISVHQINSVLSRGGNVPPEQIKAASRQVLDKLIDQELMVQQAIEKKLDRDPKVMQMLEGARREILSRAYAEQVMANAGKPAADEIKSFYAGHPELFSQRRVFNLQEIAVMAPPDKHEALRAEVAKAKTLNDVAAWLRANDIRFAVNAGVKSAEQLPMELLPKYHAIKDGQSALLTGPGGGAMVVHVASSQIAPLDEKAATPFIEQFLSNRKRIELAEAELKQLKGKAKIEYLGEFVQTAQSDEQAKPAAAAAPAKPASDKHIDKGVAGLK